MGNWLSNIFKVPPPGMPGGPPRQMTLPRLMNLLVNPFAVGRLGAANFQKNVYKAKGYGAIDPLGALFRNQDPFPIWIGADITLGAYKTARGNFPIPANFYLLNYFASTTSNTAGGFKVVVYDANQRIALTPKAINFNSLAGQGAAPLFQQVPYGMNVEGGEVKVKWTVTSLEPVSSTIEFGLYGVQIADTDPAPSGWQQFADSLHP